MYDARPRAVCRWVGGMGWRGIESSTSIVQKVTRECTSPLPAELKGDRSAKKNV